MHRKFRGPLIAVELLLSPIVMAAQSRSTAARNAARYLDSVRSQPLLLLAFLRQMPKGADLHLHLSGAVYAESYVGFAVKDGLCVDERTLELLSPPCDPAKHRPPAQEALVSQALFDRIIDAWSMRNFEPLRESGHDHFFATFSKFSPATRAHSGEMLAEVLHREASDRADYLEIMLTPDGGRAAQLGQMAGWSDDWDQLRQKVKAARLEDVIAESRKILDRTEAGARSVLQCGQAKADAGCGVTFRYLYQVGRGLPPEQVFAQILAGFELAKADSRVAGLNFVMPEDGRVALHDFTLQLRMLDFLRRSYPGVHISLHAGELSPTLVPPEDLRFHIRQSVELGHAERIGHGVDIMHEENPLELLREMAGRHILVEICLTSNDQILGIRGQQHPLPIYMQFHVPVALATDDMGVARADLTREYLRAVETYRLTYPQLKSMVRDGLDHGFLDGAGLWAGPVLPGQAQPVAACSNQPLGSPHPSANCQRFLAASPKAGLEWKVEGEFRSFEDRF